MKIINLQGMTFAERQKYLEEICQEIYNHLYDDYIWVYDGAYVDNDATYSATRLNGYQDNLDLKTGQIVYFSESGVVCLIDQINDVANTFTVQSNYSIKGDKGDKGEQGEQGEQGEKGEQGETGKIALEYSSIVALIKTPSLGESLSISLVNCNRTPVAGDKVSIFATDIAFNKIYILGLSVTNVTASIVVTTIDGIIDVTSVLPDSAKSQLYQHYFYFECSTSNNNAFFSYGLSWIDAIDGHVSPAPTTIEEVITYLESINSGLLYGIGFAETDDGVTVNEASSCIVINLRKRTDGNLYADLRKIPGNRIYVCSLKDFVNSVGEYTVTYRYNTSIAIGANSNGTNAMVLYSDKNGVLLDNENLSEQFTKLVAAGSNESKILDSINKARSMK